MASTEMVSVAFRQLVTLLRLEEGLDDLHPHDGLLTVFRAQPWDVKVFKIGVARPGTGFSAASGSWMARVSKDGPSLTIIPTMDVDRPEETVSGARFWRCLVAAVDQERAGPAPDLAPQEPPRARYWDRSKFLRWTGAGSSETNRTAGRGTRAITATSYL